MSVAMKVAQKIDEQKSQLPGLSFVDLPPDIITYILLRLPIKSVLICKSVCKSLNSLISDPDVAKLHFQHAPKGFLIRTDDPNRLSRIVHLLEYEPEKFYNSDDDQFCVCEDGFIKAECNNHLKLKHKLKLPVHGGKIILGKRKARNSNGGARIYTVQEPKYHKFNVVTSCDGFLFLCDRVMHFVVCNPVTGEFIRLPEAPKIGKSKYRHRLVCPGFGFDPKTNEYKVLRVLERFQSQQDPKGVMIVHIHTLGTSKWRNVEIDLEHIVELQFPTCMNGALHWICSHTNKGSILCFKFKKERFHSFPSPPGVFKNGSNEISNISMGDLGGFLYICDSSSLNTPVTMWILKKYNVGESWTKVFSIDTMNKKCWPYGGLYVPVTQFNNDGAILMCHSSNRFIYYEPEKCVFKCFDIRGSTQSQGIEAILHTPSFISLKEACGDNIRPLNIYSRSAKFKLPEENDVFILAKVIAQND